MTSRNEPIGGSGGFPEETLNRQGAAMSRVTPDRQLGSGRGTADMSPMSKRAQSERPATTGKETQDTAIPASVSAPSKLQDTAAPKQQDEAAPATNEPLNPLYQLTVSRSQEIDTHSYQGNEETDINMENRKNDLNESHSEQLKTDTGKPSRPVTEGHLRDRKLSREQSHSDDVDEKVAPIICPRVNCPEKIILCLDVSSELDKVSFRSRAGDRFSPLKLLKRAISFFLYSKHRLDRQHEFALVLFQDVAYWACGFTTDPRTLIHYIEDLVDTQPTETFDMSSLFDLVQDRVQLPKVDDPTVLPPPYTVRTILFYGRSQCVPRLDNYESLKLLQTSPHFFIDAYYIHEIPSDDNKCEEVFDVICSLDVNGLAYVFEVSRSVTKLYDSMAQLLPHPLQRPLQRDAAYDIESSSVEAP